MITLIVNIFLIAITLIALSCFILAGLLWRGDRQHKNYVISRQVARQEKDRQEREEREHKEWEAKCSEFEEKQRKESEAWENWQALAREDEAHAAWLDDLNKTMAAAVAHENGTPDQNIQFFTNVEELYNDIGAPRESA